MGAIEEQHIYGLQVRESADDGSDFTNPDADYRIVFLGEDGLLHAKDSSGTVTGLGGTGLINPMTTQDDIVVGGASGAPARLGKGTDGQVLTVDPTTHHLVWATPSASVSDILDLPTAETDDTLVLAPDGAGGVEFRAEAGGSGSGALVLLEQHTASASATLDFTTRNVTGQSGATFQSDFDEYMFEVIGLLPATGSVDFWIRFSSNGGSSYDTGTNYSCAIWAYAPGGSANGSVANIGAIPVRNSGEIATTSTGGLCGTVRLFHPGSTSQHKRILADWSYVSTGFVRTNVAGIWQSTSAADAIRFMFSSGNIASGTIRCYGIAK